MDAMLADRAELQLRFAMQRCHYCAGGDNPSGQLCIACHDANAVLVLLKEGREARESLSAKLDAALGAPPKIPEKNADNPPSVNYGVDRFTCPSCGRVSWNPNDVRERYCGACHQFFPRED